MNSESELLLIDFNKNKLNELLHMILVKKYINPPIAEVS